MKPGHPSEWNVDQVVEWLRAKGFDDSTCAKFSGAKYSLAVLNTF
jgi:hypothetical protein